MISNTPVSDGVQLVSDGVTADVYVDESDADVVNIAAEDFRADVERVTDYRPELVTTLDDLSSIAVIVGTVRSAEGIHRCLDDCDGVDVEALADERESFVIQTVEDPLPNVRSAVLILGSDRRGTAFGVYELSKQVGVSPWYWWADVAPDSQETVVVEPGTYRYGPPSVAYRGVFLNDEDWGLRPWASETFAPEEAAERPGLGPTTYAKIFELLLRLKANTVWPAMHPGTKAFYRYPENADIADQYAIVVGTSHCEPMHRNNVDEWEESFGEWNYATNRGRVLEYWRTRVESVSAYENVFTLGMRGIHDSGMPGGDTEPETRELLQAVLDDQRQLLATTHDRPVEAIPQVFCPYKEVLDLYRSGLDVPDDVCLMWPDDSHGYLRELPTETERARAGGSGVYYHLSYWGRPHDYLWLSSVPLGVVSTEMQKAYDAGARECWVVNVGDIKPTEKELEFFLDLAWDVDLGGHESPTAWLSDWAAREFGDAHAGEVADILSEYYRLSLARKPEHMGWSRVYPDTQPGDPEFSFTHAGDEAHRRLRAFADLAERAEAVYDALPAARQPSFYQLVLYQLRCSAAMSEKYLHAARSRFYADHGRVSANRYADAALDAHDRIRAETDHYNETLLDGKWDGMMCASPRDLPVFDPPEVDRVTPNEGSALGVAVEGRRHPLDGGAEPDGVHGKLPTFHADVERTHFVDLFNRGDTPFGWAAATSHDWIDLGDETGTVADERRLRISVDWEAMLETREKGTITVTGAGATYRIGVEASRSTHDSERDVAADFVEVDGVVAIEAEHASRTTTGSPGRWVSCDAPGRLSGATVCTEPTRFPSHDSRATAPCLEYDVALDSYGTATVDVQCLPTQALNDHRDLRYAVAFDDGPRTVVSVDPEGDEHHPEWQANVLRGAAIGTSEHDVDAAEAHTLRLWALDPGLVVDRVVVYTDAERATYLGPRETAIDD